MTRSLLGRMNQKEGCLKIPTYSHRRNHGDCSRSGRGFYGVTVAGIPPGAFRSSHRLRIADAGCPGDRSVAPHFDGEGKTSSRLIFSSDSRLRGGISYLIYVAICVQACEPISVAFDLHAEPCGKGHWFYALVHG